jgi:hypothetical protein
MQRRPLPAIPGLPAGPSTWITTATTPVDPRAAEAALPYLATHFGNPSSAHNYAAQPQRAVAGAREAVAALIGAAPGEIVFTAGGSEARCSSALVGRARRLAQCWIWPVALRPPGLGAQLLGAPTISAFSSLGGGHPSPGGAASGGQQHAQGLPLTPTPWGARWSWPSAWRAGADRVQGVAVGAGSE